MYIQTSYAKLAGLEQALTEFFDVMCNDESRDFELRIHQAEGGLGIEVEGDIQDFTSHNLVGWLSRPAFWNQSFQVTGNLLHNGCQHTVAANLDDDLGETLLAVGTDGSRYLVYIPECTIRQEPHSSSIHPPVLEIGELLATISPPTESKLACKEGCSARVQMKRQRTSIERYAGLLTALVLCAGGLYYVHTKGYVGFDRGEEYNEAAIRYFTIACILFFIWAVWDFWRSGKMNKADKELL